MSNSSPSSPSPLLAVFRFWFWFWLRWVVVLGARAAGPSVRPGRQEMATLSPADPSSYSRPDLAIVSHISLSWQVDFTEKTLSGTAELNIDVLQDIEDIILDASELAIHSIKDNAGVTLEYAVTDHVPDIGSKLTVKLAAPATSGQKLKLLIEYITNPKARALQWLEASQTSSKQHPYLFSQCQPIHARTILPCQDSPAVKFTYDATVTAPSQFTVLMSALRSENITDGGNTTRFRQPVPIPSYLLAIAVGSLQSKRLGPRSLVWSEKEELERSAWEFAETERFLQAAERLCGPYAWGQYDLLVLPPSFPYGGMENPCLTFVTPTLLAGDRSQADVIIHEIMHSWTGNLVTNCNFEDFWLNEGFTVFLERKVAASLISDEEEAKKSRDFESLLGLQELSEAINGHLGPSNPLTSLVVDLKGVHPDDAFSRVPYEKGSLFLRYLEDLVGGPSVFDEFLRSYLEHFARKSLSTNDFKSYLLNYFNSSTALQAVDWQTWLYQPGMPPVVPAYDSTLSKDCLHLVSRLHSDPASTFSYLDVKDFTPHQIIKLLQELIAGEPLPIDKLHAIGEVYRLKDSQNAEVVFRWLTLSLNSKDESIVDNVLEFVNSQGRMKYVRPLYRVLYAWEVTRARAIDNFLEHESSMMHVSAYTLRKDLHLKETDE